VEPQDKSHYLTTEKAADLVGVTKSMFIATVEEFADDWMSPVYFGRGRRKVKMWLRADVECLAHIYSRRRTKPPERLPG
jgi:hypothetical protein